MDDGDHHLLQTDWQSILSELLENGVSRDNLINVTGGTLPLLEAIGSYFSITDRLRSLKLEIQHTLRASMSYQDPFTQKESARILAYLKDGWRACLAGELIKARQNVSQRAKFEAEKRKNDKKSRYRQATEWLSEHSLDAEPQSPRQDAYILFAKATEMLESSLSNLDPSIHSEFLELVQQHTFNLVAQMKDKYS